MGNSQNLQRTGGSLTIFLQASSFRCRRADLFVTRGEMATLSQTTVPSMLISAFISASQLRHPNLQPTSARPLLSLTHLQQHQQQQPKLIQRSRNPDRRSHKFVHAHFVGVSEESVITK